MEIKIASIEMDTSIQCRAMIDTALVNEYAERMTEGDKFPPVVLFGTAAHCWIGDGWHRVTAAQQMGFINIPAELKNGGRTDALKCALSANAAHGIRRTNADKRRCVNVAIAEFGTLSSTTIAKMCGVALDTVQRHRTEQVSDSETSKVTGADGKQYPAKRKPKEKDTGNQKTNGKKDSKPARQALGPPSNGMQFARMAVMQLEQIRKDDIERQQAFSHVKGWINANET